MDPGRETLFPPESDGIIQVYAMDVDLLISLARSRVTRNLSPEECRKYFDRDDVPPIP